MIRTIRNEMKVLPSINPYFEISRRVNFIKNKLQEANCKSLILGISGGIDSTTCGLLAQLAIEELNKESSSKDYQFIAVCLPYGKQVDEESAKLALSVVRPTYSCSINIKPGVDELYKATNKALSDINLLPKELQKKDFIKGNLKARVRMITQYKIAGYLEGIVLGTDHSAENITGFYTKFGDSACDLAPLFGLNKRQVRTIASTLHTPEQLVKKAPIADLEELSPQREDEDVLNLTYDQIDDFLEGKDVDKKVINRLINLYKTTKHKRQPIPTIYD
ncbi:ammonia-dependent NAD(+) synthetase [Candidatus Photodesmus anomalopis]|uniref:ammonia-dependent NAD(+) synthetase n=1 Tax=Candidatus Photodesmus anomalopis TaxID=28176 RepID=UPI0005507C5F|nr:ammonia-dependent NAD(+) synthetase [Candidatus Photodesmus katoptron]